jgi:hypothetical protein
MLSLKRMIAAVAAMTTALLLAGCGGGGGAGAQGDGGAGAGGAAEAASLHLSTNAPSLGSDGRNTATITATVKDGSNRAMANQQVEFSTTDVGSILKVVSARTDASGAATATLQVTDPSNRSVQVNARSGSLSSSVGVAVVGTSLILNGPANLVAGAPTEFSVGLRDSSGTALGGKAVSITSSTGNALSASSLLTDAAGQARFSVTGSSTGADRLTVSALGATAAMDLVVSDTQLGFLSPSANQEISVVTPQTVTVTYSVAGVPQVGQAVRFTTTRGNLSAADVVTDGSGQASAEISSDTAGIATITASVGSVINTQRVEFVSRAAAKISLQPSPASVPVNLSASGANASQLIAVVRDANDNPVKGVAVSFSALSDPSNGRIEPAFAVTDNSGVATVAFLPGPNSTGNNQIRIQASTGAGGIAAQATLTAASQELMVRVGTGNEIEVPNITTYRMPWTAVVTDGNGNPVAGATIQASLLSTRYRKGYYVWGGSSWDRQIMATCLSEDRNGNLRLDAGEDDPAHAEWTGNGNGRLDPGNVAAASIVSEGGKTDPSGFASLRIDYPKFYGGWVEVRLRVTITTIAGTEGTDERVFVLPVLAADLTNEQVPPPGQPSPFGLASECRDPN